MTLDNLLNGDDAIDLINENKDSNNEHIDELKLENNKNKKIQWDLMNLLANYLEIRPLVT